MVAPLVPLVQSLGAWLALPNPSHWLMRTVRLRNSIQFVRCPSRFNIILFTLVAGKDAPVLCAEIVVLVVKDAIEPVPPTEMEKGFYSSYYHTEERLWVTMNPRPASFESGLAQVPVQNVEAEAHSDINHQQDWFAAINLKDVYFPVLILPRFFGSPSRVRHISTRSSPSGCPCILVSSRKLQKKENAHSRS